MDEVTKSEITRLVDRDNTHERNITKLWEKQNETEADLKLLRSAVVDEYKTHVRQVEQRSKDYTDGKFREAKLEMSINTQEVADKVIEKIDSKIQQSSRSQAKRTEWIEKIKDNVVNYLVMAALGGWVLYAARADAFLGG